MNNKDTEKEFLENFYKNMNSDKADYEKDNTDDVFYCSFSEIKEKKFMSKQSKRNHEIINTHEVFEEEYIYNNFNLNRMIEAVDSESFKLPAGLSIEEKRNFILSDKDIKLKHIADNDKIEVIKSLLDNK